MSDDVFGHLDTIDPKLQRAQSLVGTSKGRPLHDFYRTPVNAVESLLAVEKFEGNIWECACGDGAISEVLINHGYDVLSTDLIDRGYGEHSHDFLTSSYTADNVITNPPYDLCNDFIELSVERTTKKVALLTKLSILEGVKRREMFERLPLARVWVFSKRLSMSRNGEIKKQAGMICFCWLVFDHSHTGSPTIGWI